MEKDEFAIDRDKASLVYLNKSRVEGIFQVTLIFLPKPKSTDPPLENGDNKSWISLEYPADKARHGELAKNYIASMVVPEQERFEKQQKYEEKIFYRLMRLHDDVERFSQAYVQFDDCSHQVHISGYLENVKKAQDFLSENEKFIVDSERQASKRMSDGIECNSLHQARLDLSPGLESRDSCYDSDCSQSGSLRNSRQLDTHSPVDRTVSDTLGSEHTDDFEEKTTQLPSCVEIDGSSSSGSGPCSLVSVDTLVPTGTETTSQQQEYISILEYVLKLGYTESQLRLVLQKLGEDATRDAIMNELTKQKGSTDLTAPTFYAPTNYVSVESTHSSSINSFLYSDESGEIPVFEQDCGDVTEDTCGESGLPPGLLDYEDPSNLKPIVIDGSNVAMSHGNKEVFSCRGIQIVVQWFQTRGHQEITVFVPQWRKEASRQITPIEDQEILTQLEREKVLVYTPARRIAGKRVVCYDDRYIIKLAAETGGIVVSNDNYRDLINENPEYKKVIEERLLMYSFVNDRFMPPDDPLGRHGPSLDNFLRKAPTAPEPQPPVCPYGKRCTYGNKCKYFHPERGLKPQMSVSEKLAEQSKAAIQEVKDRANKTKESNPGESLGSVSKGAGGKKSLTRTRSIVTGGASGGTTTPGRPSRPVPGDLEPPPRPPKTYKYKADVGREIGRVDSGCSKWTQLDSVVGKSAEESLNSKLDRAKEYNDLLSQRRRTIERIEAEQILKENSNPEVQPVTYNIIESDPHPGFINVGWESQTNPNPNILKPTFSDSQLLADGGCGHLSLAKKLSDESLPPNVSGNAGLRARSSNQPKYIHDASECLAQMPPPPPPCRSQKVSSSVAEEAPQTLHRKLERQLSLAGPQDVRWIQTQQHQPQQTLTSRNLYQHSRQPPVSATEPAVVHQHPNHLYQSYNGGGHFTNSAMAQNPAFYPPGPSLTTDNTQTFPSATHSPYSDFELLPSRSGSYDSTHLLSRGPYPNVDDSHLPEHMRLARMSSAPGAYVQGNSTLRQSPAMNRQNSTSDSNLHILSEGDDRGKILYARGTIPYPEDDQNVQMSWPEVTRPNTYGLQSHTGYQQPPYRHLASKQHVYQPIIPSPLVASEPLTYHSAPGTGMYQDHSNQFVIHSHPKAGLHREGFTFDPMPQPRAMTPPQPVQFIDNAPQYTESVPQNIKPQVQSAGEITPNHPRYNTYYHLCGLFPEEQVRKVINQHPNESNPQKLCTYLINMGS